MNLNSPLVQWLLKVAMSKAGPFIGAAAAWVAAHLVAAIGLPAFLSPNDLAKIQNGLSQGVDLFGMSLLASAYAWVVHRQTQAVKIAKAQIEIAPIDTPGIDHQTGAVGNATLDGLAKITGVSVEQAADAAGIPIKRALPVN